MNIVNDNLIYCQRAIYVADILKRFFVCNPSILNEMSILSLKELFYSKGEYLICI